MADEKAKFKLSGLAATPKPAPNIQQAKLNPPTKRRVNPFADDDDAEDASPSAAATLESAASGSRSAPPKRHFAGSVRSLKSGPGTLDVDIGRSKFDLGPPGRGPRGELARHAPEGTLSKAEEERRTAEKVAPNPTIRLESLYPSISEGVIRALVPSTMKIQKLQVFDSVKDNPLASRKSKTAIVEIDKATPSNAIDMLVSNLQNQYLRFGYYLKISRGLSSAVQGTERSAFTASLVRSEPELPFGAKPTQRLPGAMNAVPPPQFGQSYNAVPPPPGGQSRGRGHDRDRGDPDSRRYLENRGFQDSRDEHYSSGRAEYPDRRRNQDSRPYQGRGYQQERASEVPVEVSVVPPTSIVQIKMINKLVEQVLQHGPQFEALLMTRPEVQSEEKWSWLWDARSPGGVWYRWRLWQLYTKFERRKAENLRDPKAHQIFGGAPPWIVQESMLPFEFATNFEQIRQDSAYDSDNEGHAEDSKKITDVVETDYLNPKDRVQLVHLLARLPTEMAKLQRNHLARVTAFAIEHTRHGAQQVADLLVQNVKTPFNLSPKANLNHAELENTDELRNPERAVLVALHVISDVVWACGNTTVFKAGQYRNMIEDRLRKRKIFAYIGLIAKDESLSLMRQERWKRSINVLLELWETWSAFGPDTLKTFLEQVNNPPLTVLEQDAIRKQEELRQERIGKSKTIAFGAQKEGTDADLEEPNLDGEPMTDSDLDGVPMTPSDEEMEEEDLGTRTTEDVDVDIPLEMQKQKRSAERSEDVDMEGPFQLQKEKRSAAAEDVCE